VIGRAGTRTRVAEHPFFHAWLGHDSRSQERLARGLMLCARDFAKVAGAPIGMALPSWAAALLTEKERRAFDTLSLPPSCSAREARKRVRCLTVTHHPDRGGSEGKMKEINEAFAVVQRVVGF